MLKKAPFLIFFCGIVIGLCSCNGGAMYKKYTTLPDNIWDVKSPVTFTVPVKDTVNNYDIFVNVRNADSYTFSNLYLFIDIASPMHVTERDTMECQLADPNTGKWLGEGLGDIWDNKILFKRNVRFPRSGDYIFTYTQAMRVDKLPLIMDVGLSIEPAKAKTH
jgi:gliding motility-associated lipoprotein GldH